MTKPINPQTLHDMINKAESQPTVSGIVIGAHKDIYYMHNGNAMQVGERPGAVLAFVLHNGRLYDAGEYDGVYDTMDNRLAIMRDRHIDVLASHKGELYSAERCDCGNSIIYRLKNDSTAETVGKRDGQVLSLVSHNGELFDSGKYGQINDTLKFKQSKFRGTEVRPCSRPWSQWTSFQGIRLALNNNKLYDVSIHGVFDTLENKMIYGLESVKEEPKSGWSRFAGWLSGEGAKKSGSNDWTREYEVHAQLSHLTSFISHNNRLYLANYCSGMPPGYSIFDVSNKTTVDDGEFDDASHLLSHDGELYAGGSTGLWRPLRKQGEILPLCQFGHKVTAVASVPQELRVEMAEKGVNFAVSSLENVLAKMGVSVDPDEKPAGNAPPAPVKMLSEEEAEAEIKATRELIQRFDERETDKP